MIFLFNNNGDIIDYASEDFEQYLLQKFKDMLRTQNNTNNLTSLYPSNLINTFINSDVENYIKNVNNILKNDIDFSKSNNTYSIKIVKDPNTSELVIQCLKNNIEMSDMVFRISDIIYHENIVLEKNQQSKKLIVTCLQNNKIVLDNYVNNKHSIIISEIEPELKELSFTVFLKYNNSFNLTNKLIEILKNDKFGIHDITIINGYLTTNEELIINKDDVDNNYMTIKLKYFINEIDFELHNFQNNAFNQPLNCKFNTWKSYITSKSILKNKKYYISTI